MIAQSRTRVVPILATALITLLAGCVPSPEHELPITQIRRAETSSDERLIDALQAFIPEVMRAKRTPGLNIALARRGNVIWEAGFGYADLAEQRAMTPTTVFRSGSMGKTYVATAIMQLVEKGVMRLDDPINKHLDFEVTNPLGDRDITVEDLLTHRTGLASNAAHSEFALPPPLGEHLKARYAEETFPPYRSRATKHWSAKVGERFQYSNFGMATLGYLVEVTNPDGLSFPDYVQRSIMDPLGMTSSMYPWIQDSIHVRADIYERFSTGYASIGDVQIPTPAIYFADYPAGNVVSIPGDHIKLLLAYLNDGTYNGYQLLQPETIKLMLTPQVEGFGGTVQIGLTWMLGDVGETDFSFGHGGAHMYGWHNDFQAYPELEFAVAVATNHWRLPSAAIDREYVLIEDFIVNWLQQRNATQEPDRSLASWTWKTSYVMGLIVAENLTARLGIRSPLTPEMVDAMIASAKVGTAPAHGEAGWDADGFRAGVADILSVEMTPEAMRAFVESDRLQVSREELEQIARELGSRGTRVVGGPGS